MKKIFFIIIFFYINPIYSQKIIISGYVSDSETKEKLIGAIVAENDNVVIKNEFGFYSIKINTNDTIKINYRYLGYSDTTISFFANKDLTNNIYLKSKVQIGEVYIYGAKQKNLNSYNFTSKEISLLPSLTGEKDAIKAFQLLPGVQFGCEGSANIYVRGGTPDQNLILLDDIPLHYINHIGSFVSIFDINAINNIELIKNGIPARYSGHLSSVMDIRLKDGNMNKLEGNFTLGLLTTKISLNGPIIKNKLSFVFTLRKCNLEMIGLYFYFGFPNQTSLPIYTFYDVNLKLNYKISDKDKIDILFYNGLDINRVNMFDNESDPFLIQEDIKYKYISNNNWGNNLNSIRWTHRYGNKIFQKLIFGYTSYHYKKKQSLYEIYKDTDSTKKYSSLEYYTKIQDLILKLDYDYFLNSHHKINFGISSFYHKYTPGSFKLETWKDGYEDTIYNNKNEKILSPIDFDLYVEDSWSFNKFTVNFGLHTNIYYLSKKIHYNVQPRFKLLFEPTSQLGFLFSYDKTYQNLHVLTISNSVVPADIWVPATQKAPPESANQYSFGFYKYFGNKKYNLSISVFYKNSKNLIDYQKYFYINDTIENYTWENQIVTGGIAKIYGLEFLLEKNKGKFNGFISYTYMKNTRQFDELNNGIEFPFNYDRRHTINIVSKYEFSKNFSISAIFMYGSGYPITLPFIKQNYINIIEGQDALTLNNNPIYVDEETFYSSKFSFNGKTFIYNKINSYRMPAYHRLDIAINWSKKKKKGVRTWSLNIYNIYNHQNAFFLFLSYDKNNKIHLYKYTLFPIIASLSYSFKF